MHIFKLIDVEGDGIKVRIKLFLITTCVITLLSGCAAIKEMKAERDLKRLNNAKASCLEYGFKESTDSFASCIQKEINEIKNRAALESASKEIKKD